MEPLNSAHPLLMENFSSEQAIVPKRRHRTSKLFPVLMLLVLGIIVGTSLAFTPHFFSESEGAQSESEPGTVKAAETSLENIKQTYSWRPNTASITADPKITVPTISAKSALVMDLDTGKVYYAKDGERKVPMASITKVMTALLTKENARSTDLFTVSDFAATVGENAMGVLPGEKYTTDELLWGLFLHSGNDAAETLAEGIGKNRQNFITMMNRRAKELGMQNTLFINPSGMEENRTMRTTVVDLAILSKFTLEKYPELLDITKTIEKVIPSNQYHRKIGLVGEIDLIRTYPGAVGFKTGYTDEAGRCIITVVENQGKRMMAIVLGSQDRRVDAVKLLDYAYKSEGITIKHEPYW